MTAGLLRLLLGLYLPFLLAPCGLMGWLIVLIVQAVLNLTCVATVAWPLVALLGLTLLQVLWSLPVLFARPARPAWSCACPRTCCGRWAAPSTTSPAGRT